MSRVGKTPISIPDKTKITYKDRIITVQGDKGTLTRSVHPAVDLKIEGGMIKVGVVKDDRTSGALRGLTRSLVANMVIGVSKGFERVLEIHGIGYRAVLSGNCIEFNLGYSHPVEFPLPEGVTAEVDHKARPIKITLTGFDKQLVGQVAANIRALRPPDSYKGKGIRYAGERLKLKPGKAGKK